MDLSRQVCYLRGQQLHLLFESPGRSEDVSFSVPTKCHVYIEGRLQSLKPVYLVQKADESETLTTLLSDFFWPQQKALHKGILCPVFHIFRMILRLTKQKCT